MTDRELDALVAEKVFGWRPWVNKRGAWVVETPDGQLSEGDAYASAGSWAFFYDDELPRYCTDIADAWRVVEKMRERWHFSIDSGLRGLTTAKFWAREGLGYGACPDELAPRAICLAALRAVGVEVSP